MPELGYDVSYFEPFRKGTRDSAMVVVPLVRDLLQPSTVVDVGCGLGTWLKVFEEQGVREVCGIDGAYVDPDALEIGAERFIAADLRTGLDDVDQRFDLAVSLEVAEHLPEQSAAGFVRGLTGLAPAVLFFAAIPNQGGRGHINEQWPEYWAAQFQPHDYVAVDCLRPMIWDNPRVQIWYAQNLLLFVERPLLERYPELKRWYECFRIRQLSIVHPRMFEWVLERPWHGLKALSRSREAGILTEEEFQVRKARILSRMGGAEDRLKAP